MTIRIIELSKDLKSEGYYITMYAENGKLIMRMKNLNNDKITDTEVIVNDIDSTNDELKNKLKDKVK